MKAQYRISGNGYKERPALPLPPNLLPLSGSKLWSGAVSREFAGTMLVQQPDPLKFEEEFKRLAAQWHRETDHLSNIVRKAMSPVYQEIIGMGEKVLPLILRDLEITGGHWFWALKAIARFDAAAGANNYDDAVRAWLGWGSRHGYR
jgi:hypothetical protein